MVAFQIKRHMAHAWVLALIAVFASAGLGAVTVRDVDVETRGGRYVLVVKADGRLDPSLQLVGDRMVFKIKGGKWGKRRAVTIRKGPVSQVRFGSHPDKGELHMVLDLRQKAVDRKVTPNSKGMEVDLGPVLKAERKPDTGRRLFGLAPSNTGFEFRIVDVVHEDRQDQSRVIVTADGPVRYKTELSNDGKRLTLNFDNAALTWDGESFSDSAIRGFRADQGSSRGRDQVQIHVDFTEKLKYGITRDQNQVIVAIDKPEERVKEHKTGSIYRRIDLDVHDADLIGTLETLSRQAGFDYVFTTDMLQLKPPESRVTFKADNMTLGDVLNYILAEVDMTFNQQGNVLYFGEVGKIKSKKELLPQIVDFHAARTLERDVLLKYMEAEAALDKTLPDESVIADPDPDRTDRILMKGTRHDVAKLKAMARRYDKYSGADVDEAGADELGPTGRKRNLVFKLSYISEDEAETAIKQVAKNAEIVKMPLRRQLVVTANIRDLRTIETLLQRIDTKIPEVSIKAMIVEVDVNEVENIGMSWGANSAAGSDPSIDGSQSAPARENILAFTVGSIQNGINLEATITALENDRKAKVLSSPTIRTQSGVAGQIKSEETLIYIARQTIVSEGVPFVNTTPSEQKVPLTLNVTPSINESDNDVLMKVDFELVSLTGQQLSADTKAPFTTQSATTTFRLRNGETGALGGLIRETNITDVAKVPILGDIPLLGLLFKRTEKSKRKREVVILLTPTIMN